MPGLRTLSGAEVRAILEANGFVFISQKGSHMKMRKVVVSGDGLRTTLTVPVLAHKTVQIGTLSSIIRQSQLPRSLFES